MFDTVLLTAGVIVTAIVSGVAGIFLGGALKLGRSAEGAVIVSYLVLFAIAAAMIFVGAGSAVAWIGLAFFGLLLGSAVRGALS